ncbi:cardiolipin synthase [Shewanella eurypsychrophilus]|uniref:Cardiolipin synthase A n=1 Tax=Shewanella eurypsychrophilus TaxID=2593656 RepID=A0ABX6V884_9GAMM|nr:MULTISPECIES: cardiolipin synthase [Shewanella]QFU22909.1 cardiolipin synthase [Shewanella sp. YLB-09]QPG58195.1 cardiolipin synthase [Shewanella eurypsychrophilus]
MDQVYQLITLLSVLLYWVIIIGITVRVVIRRRSIGVSFAWVMVIYVIPVVGIVAYLLFGEQNIGRTRALRAKEMYQPYADWFSHLFTLRQYQPTMLSEYAQTVGKLCENHLGIPSLADNSLMLKSSPQEILTSIIKDIDSASESIYLEFYIWHPGGMADEVANALINAAQRGIEVRLLLDSAGSYQFFRSQWPKRMQSAGVELARALKVSPLRVLFRRMDLRMHRKIVIIDNMTAYTGSMNLVDPSCFKTNSGVGEWIDVMVRIQGSSVPLLNAIQSWDWEVETNQRFLPKPPICKPHSIDEKLDLVQVIPSGPGMPEEIIHEVLLQSLYQAKHKIVITTPYFVPSENLQVALIAAAHRGICVNIIIPDKNDSLMVEWASRSFFSELLEAGVKIHRFKGGLLHTKSVVIDEAFSLIGTVNLDMRSLWLNFELTLAVDDLKFTQELTSLQQEYIANSSLIDAQQWHKRPVYNRITEQFFYLFSPLL